MSFMPNCCFQDLSPDHYSSGFGEDVCIYIFTVQCIGYGHTIYDMDIDKL